MCLPEVASYYATITAALPAGFTTVIKDIDASYGVIVGSAGIALLLGFIFMILIRYFAGPLLWLFLLTINVTFFVIGGISAYNFKNYGNNTSVTNASAASVLAAA